MPIQPCLLINVPVEESFLLDAFIHYNSVTLFQTVSCFENATTGNAVDRKQKKSKNVQSDFVFAAEISYIK